MSDTEWVLRAALFTWHRAPLLTVKDAIEIAEELHFAWPALTPEEAVRAYYAQVEEPCEEASTAH